MHTAEAQHAEAGTAGAQHSASRRARELQVHSTAHVHCTGQDRTGQDNAKRTACRHAAQHSMARSSASAGWLADAFEVEMRSWRIQHLQATATPLWLDWGMVGVCWQLVPSTEHRHCCLGLCSTPRTSVLVTLLFKTAPACNWIGSIECSLMCGSACFGHGSVISTAAAAAGATPGYACERTGTSGQQPSCKREVWGGCDGWVVTLVVYNQQPHGCSHTVTEAASLSVELLACTWQQCSKP